MSNIGPVAGIRLKSQVIENCWQYVYENFHKFNEHNKIKVALAILSKDMPTKLEGAGLGTKVIIVKDKDGRKADSRSTPIPEEIPR
jgi:hypothetical protein